MRKSATVPISRWPGPALVSWAHHFHEVFHLCTGRCSASSRPVEQDDESGAGLLRGQDGTPSVRARPAKLRRPAGGAAPALCGPKCGMCPVSACVRASWGVPSRCNAGVEELLRLDHGTAREAGCAMVTCFVANGRGTVEKRYAPTRALMRMNVLSR